MYICLSIFLKLDLTLKIIIMGNKSKFQPFLEAMKKFDAVLENNIKVSKVVNDVNLSIVSKKSEKKTTYNEKVKSLHDLMQELRKTKP